MTAPAYGWAHGGADLVLTESRTLRARTADRTDVLDKVKALALLLDDTHATTEIVADYYEVSVPTIDSLVESNREELEASGRRVLKGAELREFAAPFGGAANLGLSPKARSLAVFNRRAILNVGQLLRDSEVAMQVRTHLLVTEEQATAAARVASVDTQSLTPARMFFELAQQFMEQETRLAGIEQVQAATAAKVAGIEGRYDWFTALGYAKLHGHPTSRGYLQRVGKAATAILHREGGKPEPRQDATFGTVNTYPVPVLDRAFSEVPK